MLILSIVHTPINRASMSNSNLIDNYISQNQEFLPMLNRPPSINNNSPVPIQVIPYMKSKKKVNNNKYNYNCMDQRCLEDMY